MNTKGKIPMSEFHNPYFLRKRVRIVVDIRFACKHKRTLINDAIRMDFYKESSYITDSECKRILYMFKM